MVFIKNDVKHVRKGLNILPKIITLIKLKGKKQLMLTNRHLSYVNIQLTLQISAY